MRECGFSGRGAGGLFECVVKLSPVEPCFHGRGFGRLCPAAVACWCRSRLGFDTQLKSPADDTDGGGWDKRQISEVLVKNVCGLMVTR